MKFQTPFVFVGLILIASTVVTVAGNCKISSCPNIVDLTIVLDSSGSIRDAPSGTWDSVKQWLSDFVGQLAIGPNYVKIAMVNYAENATTEFDLNRYDNINDVRTGILDMKFKSGNTNTAKALRYLRDEIYREDRGDRSNAKNVAIFITDGYATIDFLRVEEAATYCREKTTLISVGVTNKTNNHNLKKIATNQQLVLIAEDYTMLTTFTDNIMQMVADSLPATAKLDPVPVHETNPSDDRVVIIEGEKGATGDQGSDGDTGATGAQGETGEDGKDGATGATGPQGPQGEAGVDGTDGVDGEDGDDGNHGHTGHTGPQGEQGLPGPPGPAGEPGTSSGGSSGSDGHQITVEGGDASVQVSGMGESTVIIVSVIGAIIAVALMCGACCVLFVMRRNKQRCNSHHDSQLTLPRLSTDCAGTQTTVREKKVRGLDNPVVLITTNRERGDNFANETAIASPSLIDFTK